MPPIPLRPAPDPTPTLASLQRTLSDVRTYQLPRLRGSSSVTLARELADEARADLETVRSGLEESRELCEALPDNLRGAVLGMWEGVEEEYLSVRDEFRAALIASKRAISAAARKHELLDPEEAPRAEAVVGVGGEDALQTKTNEVTDAMRRTAQLLQAELEKSVMSAQMLDESTQTLRTTHGLYDSYTALLTTSSQLVRALERADFWDRVIIMSALGFFLLCVAYVIKRRVLDRVGGFAAWWIGGSFKLVKMGLGRKPAAVGAVSDLAGAAGAVAGTGARAAAGVTGVPAAAGGTAAAGTLASLAEQVLEATAAAAASVAAASAGAAGVGVGGSEPLAGTPLGAPDAPRLALHDSPGLVAHEVVDEDHGDEAHGGEADVQQKTKTKKAKVMGGGEISSGDDLKGAGVVKEKEKTKDEL